MNVLSNRSVAIAVSAFALCLQTGMSQAANGPAIYATSCVSCHATGVLDAPKLGVEIDWRLRREKGLETLVSNAINGLNAMPPRGGNATLTDADIRAVVEFMLSRAVPASAKNPAATVVAAAAGGNSQAAAVVSKPMATASEKKKPVQKKSRTAQKVNSFNRLLKPPSQRNLPPMKDGIHDPANDGTAVLQHPREAFNALPKANSGNRVDWVGALEQGDVQPRFDLEDENRKPVVLDLNIVREVKGSMPDVVYPHKQHTEWLDCSNCHPSIFIPKKGANHISMAGILLGEKCGVCHGKVAFPVSECRKCHSKNKAKVSRK